MDIFSHKCPNCGANVIASINGKQIICEYCDSIVVFENKLTQNERINNELIIRRIPAMTGVACKMICYINGNEIGRLRENEQMTYKTTEKEVVFMCRLTLGNPMSDPYKVTFNNDKVYIEAKQGLVKPKVTIKYL